MQTMTVPTKAFAHNPLDAITIDGPPGPFLRDRKPEACRSVAIMPGTNRKTSIDRSCRLREEGPKIPRSPQTYPARQVGTVGISRRLIAIRPTNAYVLWHDVPSAPYVRCVWPCGPESRGSAPASTDWVERFFSCFSPRSVGGPLIADDFFRVPRRNSRDGVFPGILKTRKRAALYFLIGRKVNDRDFAF